MYEIFDPKDLSDDELFDRIQRARHFLGVHIDYGHDSLVHSLQLTIAVLEEEQEYRMLKKKTEYEEESRQRSRNTQRNKNNRSVEPKDTPDSGTITLGHIDGIDE